MHFISLLPIVSSMLLTRGWSHGIMHARLVVTDHRQAQNIGFLADFLRHLRNAAVSRESLHLFSCSFIA